ncbi:MAG: conjugal transfer protein [Pseudoclavibacter sp.]|nr:conjugal transfer protein [Pseudoclavibacter sp.]
MRPRLSRPARGASGGGTGQGSPPGAGAVRTSGWTAGRALAARAQTLLAWSAVCCGPLALAAALTVPAPAPETVQAEPPQARLSPAQQAAGAHALGFVGAWLTATRDDPAGLEAYLGPVQVQSAQPQRYRDLAVASVEPDRSGATVSVVVTALLLEAAGPGEEAPGQGEAEQEASGAWRSRYFQVAVAVADPGLRVLGMPAQIAAPPVAEDPAPPSRELGDAPELAQAVQLFLSAYLSGSEELERFTSPDSGIRAIRPGPYAAASLRGLSAASGQDPERASEVRVLALIDAQAANGRVDAMSYWLRLRVRDQRWEVVSIDPGPVAGEGGAA